MSEKTVVTANTIRSTAGVGTIINTHHEGVARRGAEDSVIKREETSDTVPETPPTETRIVWSEKYNSAIKVDKNGNVLEVLQRQKP